MRIFYLFFLVFVFTSLRLFSQEGPSYPFMIDGHVNADTGRVKLEILFDTDYYTKGMLGNNTAVVENKRFTIKGNMPYPQGVTLIYNNTYYSSLFVIEPGYQSVWINIDSLREVPIVDNKAMKEYAVEFTANLSPVNHKRHLYTLRRDSIYRKYANKIPDSLKLGLEMELKGYYRESDSLFLKYVQEHPGSYLALWKFIHLFSAFGYEGIFDNVYEQFSDSLKNTFVGEVLKEKLKIAASLDYGRRFPGMAILDKDGESTNTADILAKNEHTYLLLDFWYSNCNPCIRQFSRFRKIYKKYKRKGFEIIGISTDRLKQKDKWQAAIHKYKLKWPQFWDADGSESSKFSINKFPSNFLLDENGNIIKKDISPVELDDFLQNNIK